MGIPNFKDLKLGLGPGNLIKFQGSEEGALFEVKVLDKRGKIKKIISKDKIKERHWEVKKAEDKNRRYKGSTKRGEVYYVGT
jgi:hypothetical protein